MPKPNGAKEKAKEIPAIRHAWSTRGSAVLDFLPENVNQNDAYLALETLVNTNKYGTGREELGAFLCMCMLGQKDSNGEYLYNIKDIITPGRYVEEKKALCSKLMTLMTPVIEDGKVNEKETNENLKEIDAFLQSGITRSGNYMERVMSKNLSAENISGIINPEVATVAHMANIIFNNNAGASYEIIYEKINGEINRKKTLLDNTPVHRLKAAGFDIEKVHKTYAGVTDLIYTSSENLESMVNNYVENGKEAGTFNRALINYIMFAGASMRFKTYGRIENVVPSFTTEEYIRNLTEGVEGSKTIIHNITDINPLEYSRGIVDGFVPESLFQELDEKIEEDKVDEFIDDLPENALKPRREKYVEAYTPYAKNMEDDVYRYGIVAMYLNGHLFKNVTFDADPYIDNKNPDGKTSSKSYVAFGNISINFDKTFERENVLREAYLSDLDAGEFHFEPVVEEENGANFSAINQARTENLRQLKQSLDALEPKWNSSSEWKNMKTVLEKAISVSERYQNTYATRQNGPEATAALEELNSAMQMVQIAARNYVEHKVEKVDFREGDDFSRLKAAKRLENFGRNQDNYLTAKLTKEVKNTLDLGTERHIESVKSDKEVIDRLYSGLDSLYNETFFHSTELDELKDSLDSLKRVQNAIIGAGKITSEANSRYYGVTTPEGHTTGAIENVIEKAQKYIDHRITEGLSEDRYSKRVDMAMRIKNYLEAVQENADRAQNKRLELYRNSDTELQRKNIDKFNRDYRVKIEDLSKTVKAIKAGDKKLEGSIDDIKDTYYYLFACMKYEKDASLTNKKLNASESEIVKFAKAGDVRGAIKFMKSNVDAKEFVDTHTKDVASLEKYLGEIGVKNAFTLIESRAAKRRTVANCIEKAREYKDGRMRKDTFAEYVVNRSVLEMVKAGIKEKNKDDKGVKSKRTSDEVKRVQNSEELEAVIKRYEGTEDFASKMEAMYFDYAQLAVYTKKEGKMPEDIDRFFEDLKTNKINIVKDGNEPVKENKPQVDAKKPEEVKQIQEVVKIN